jgi:hypothetical protein
MAALNNQATYEMRPDKSGPSGYEDSHSESFGITGYQGSGVKE